MKNECIRLLNESTLALQQWREPIDVLITLYALVDVPDIPLPIDIKDDEMLQSMQQFYNHLDKIPTEAMILIESFPLFSQVAISEVEARKKSGKPLDTIGDPKQVHRLSPKKDVLYFLVSDTTETSFDDENTLRTHQMQKVHQIKTY